MLRQLVAGAAVVWAAACGADAPAPSRARAPARVPTMQAPATKSAAARAPGAQAATTQTPGAQAPASGAAPLTAGAGAPGEWTLPARDYAASRYSPLGQITPAHAGRLRVVWSFTTGALRGHEGQPLVVGNTMYVVTPYPNVLYAFDLTREGYPLRWKYRPDVNPAVQGTACCDVVNRGAVYWDGKIIYNLLDDRTVAVDAATGRPVWITKLGDVDHGETITMAPLVVHGKVLVGNSGGEYGVRGWLKALDARDGHVVWTGYSTGPDRDVLIDSSFRPFYATERGRDLGVSSWPADAWRTGAGAVWGWLSYDPSTNLVYSGTSNPGPWNTKQRPGDNTWTAALLARDADTGRLRWAFQETPHDEWDYDGMAEPILVDLPVRGRTRHVVVRFDRNGFVYVLDRGTGELLSATPFVPVTWARGVDLRTGRPLVDPAKETGEGRSAKGICPSLEGGKDQQPAAYSPRTGLFYVPTNNICMDFTARRVTYIAGTPYIGASAPYSPGPGGNLGEFMAWDAANGRKVWGIKEPYPVWGGALTTAGGVVVYGTLDGWVKVVDDRTGRLLWKLHAGSGIVGNPIAYLGPDGKEYIALYSGIGGDMGLLLSGDTRSDDPNDLRAPPTSFMPDLARHTSWGGGVWVFGL